MSAHGNADGPKEPEHGLMLDRNAAFGEAVISKTRFPLFTPDKKGTEILATLVLSTAFLMNRTLVLVLPGVFRSYRCFGYSFNNVSMDIW